MQSCFRPEAATIQTSCLRFVRSSASSSIRGSPRAESVFNLATAIEEGGPIGERENVFQRLLHEQSHGESFLDIAVNRLGPRGFYIFDEPEAALSVKIGRASCRERVEIAEVAGAVK